MKPLGKATLLAGESSVVSPSGALGARGAPLTYVCPTCQLDSPENFCGCCGRRLDPPYDPAIPLIDGSTLGPQTGEV